MATQSSQLSLADVFTECQDLLYFDKPAFFVLLEKHIDFDAFIPADFYHAFNRRFDRNRKYPLHGFVSALIPWNPRNQSELPVVGFNTCVYPLCPAADALPMKRIGLCHEKGCSDRIKWGCPKIHIVKGSLICDCELPCSPAKFGRTTYTYDHQDFRLFPEIQRDSVK